MTTEKYKIDITTSCQLLTSSLSSVVSVSILLAIYQVTAHAGTSEKGSPLSAEVTYDPTGHFQNTSYAPNRKLRSYPNHDGANHQVTL